MFTKKALIIAVAVLAVSANAAREITPQEPALVNGCYQISNAEELYGFSQMMYDWAGEYGDSFYGCAELTQDITVNANVFKNGTLNNADTANFATWIPIRNFLGTFDGKGHTIYGLYYNSEGEHTREYYRLDEAASRLRVGFFRDIKGDSYKDTVIIKNLHIKDAYFKAYHEIGGITGMVDYATLIISGCSVDGVIEGWEALGGFVGHQEKDLEDDSRDYDGFITRQIGELVIISNSYNRMSINGDEYVGGFVGYAEDDIVMMNVYNVGSITANQNAGGIIGEGKKFAYLFNVYNAGAVVSTDDYDSGKPIVGSVWEGVAENNWTYYDNVLYLGSEQNDSYGIPVSAEDFENGAVAKVLHDYKFSYFDGLFDVDGSIWGQKVGVDLLPNFSGVIENATSATIVLSLDTGSTTLWTKQIPPGFRYKLPVVERSGYKLLGWYDNAEFSGDSVTHVPETQTTDVKYWGHYERKYKVTLEMEDATVDSAYQVDSYVYMVGAKLPTFVSRKGYVFAGWYTNEELNGAAVDSISATATGDTTFYAKWLEIKTPVKDVDGCYAISDAAELYGFAAIVNGTDGYAKEKAACGKLTKDIVVNENVLNSDGSLNKVLAAGFMQWNPLDSFAGIFDGNMHTISGLYVQENPLQDFSGKGMGFVGSTYGSKKVPTVVKNIGIVNSYFLSNFADVGAIVGNCLRSGELYVYSYTEIKNSYSTSTVISNYANVGGVVGSVKDAHLEIENCYNIGYLQGFVRQRCGGIVGYTNDGSTVFITNCYSAGNIVAPRPAPIANGRERLGYYICVWVENSYYLNSLASGTTNSSFGKPMTAELLKNGAVALLLHEGSNGTIWGQNVGVDDHPVFSGEVKNADGAKKSVTFHTIEGDTAKYFNYYIPGYSKRLPDEDDVTAPHMDFLGWYDNAKFNGDVVEEISENATGDLDFYAKLEPHLYRVHTAGLRLVSKTFLYTPTGAVEGVDEDKGYKYGEKITLKAITEEGYCFSYWYDDAENHNPMRTIMVASDTSIRAIFEESDSACPEYSSSSEELSSSSSEPASSSSVESSSSSAKSHSSSSVLRSSSSIKSSSSKSKSSSSIKSSSSKSKSSSSAKSGSSTKSSSSSKKGKSALPTVAVVPQFSVEVVGRDIRVSGAFDARSYALLDMQGRVLRRGPVTGVSFAIPVDRAGTYFVRIGNGMQRVSVK